MWVPVEPYPLVLYPHFHPTLSVSLVDCEINTMTTTQATRARSTPETAAGGSYVRRRAFPSLVVGALRAVRLVYQ
jgi:hypothetical protein